MKINKKFIIFFVLVELFQVSNVFAAIKTDPNVQLINAAKAGDLKGVQNALNKGANVNIKSYGPHGNTALHIAVWDGNVDLVRLLRKNGANPGILNNQGKSSIDLARERGHYEMAKKFEEDLGITSVLSSPSQVSQLQQPVIGSLSARQQIVKVLEKYRFPVQGQCSASAQDWQDMLNALEIGNLFEVNRLIGRFGSSLWETKGASPRSLLEIAQFNLKQATGSSLSSQVGKPSLFSYSHLQSQLSDLSLNDSPVWKSPFTIVDNLRQLQIVEGKPVTIQNGKVYWGNTFLCDLTKTPVRFYHPKQDYYGQWFSNFSQHQVIYGGDKFSTSEHAFQAQKIVFKTNGKNQDYYKILNSNDPDEAKKVARQYFTQGWDFAKIDVMLNILRAKFKQNSDCAQMLKSTGDRPLLEHTVTSNDKEWGIGAKGTGKNLLGILLMIVRSEI